MPKTTNIKTLMSLLEQLNCLIYDGMLNIALHTTFVTLCVCSCKCKKVFRTHHAQAPADTCGGSVSLTAKVALLLRAANYVLLQIPIKFLKQHAIIILRHALPGNKLYIDVIHTRTARAI